MPQSQTNFDAALKDDYGPGLRESINNSNVVWTEATTAQTPLRAHHVATGQTLLHLVAPDEQPRATATQVD